MQFLGQGVRGAAARCQGRSLLLRREQPHHRAKTGVAAAAGDARQPTNPGGFGWTWKGTVVRNRCPLADPYKAILALSAPRSGYSTRTPANSSYYAAPVSILRGIPASASGRGSYCSATTVLTKARYYSTAIPVCVSFLKAAQAQTAGSCGRDCRTFSSDYHRTTGLLLPPPKMVCFCFRRNKVGPLKKIEIPDITAVPEGATTAVDHANNTSASNAGSLEAAAATEEASRENPERESPAGEAREHSADSALHPAAAHGEEMPSSAEASAGLARQASAASPDQAVPVGSESSATDVSGRRGEKVNAAPSSLEEGSAVLEKGYDVVSLGVTIGETVDGKSGEKPISPLAGDKQDAQGIKVSKRTFGRFDVYSSSFSTESAGADPHPSAGKALDERPLVIMIPWLNAKPRHVQKYNDMYVQRGMDVLHLNVSPLQILRPHRTKKIIGQLFSLLKDEEGSFASRPILVHGFSIGAFVWGQMLVEMETAVRAGSAYNDGNDFSGPVSKTEPSAAVPDVVVSDATASTPITKMDSSGDGEKGSVDNRASPKPAQNDTKEEDKPHNESSTPTLEPSTSNNVTATTPPSTTTITSTFTTAAIHQRIVGVVMDSPTPLANILDGIPSSVSHNTVVKGAFKAFLYSYLRLFPDSVHAHYVEGEEACSGTHAQGLPLLILYSSADVIARAQQLEAFVDHCRGNGMRVRVRKWEDSPHVGHFRFYPDEYREEVQMFLEELGHLVKEKE